MGNDANSLKTARVPIFDLCYMTTATGDIVSIRNIVETIEIVEDIFSPVLTGSITIADSIGLFDHLPISGNETITLRFYSSSYDTNNYTTNFIHRTFDVIRVNNVTSPTDHSKKYTLTLASPELKKSETIKISKAYKDMSISEIVTDIMTGNHEDPVNPSGLGFPKTASKDNSTPRLTRFFSPFLKDDDIEVNYEDANPTGANSVELFVEKTKYKEKVLSTPYMKPLDLIKWLATRSLRNATGRVSYNHPANFMFFENKRGFQFVSLNTLLENKGPNIATFVYGSATANNQDDNWHLDVIEKLRIENCYDVLANIRNGIYASNFMTYEVSTGQVTEQPFDYVREFYNNESTDRSFDIKSQPDYPTIALDKQGQNPITQKLLARRMLLPMVHRDYDGVSSGATSRFNTALDQVGPEQYLQSRISQLSKLVDFRVIVDIPANTQHKVGDMVVLDLKMWQNKTGTEGGTDKSIEVVDHKYYNGNYLITSIKHSLSQTEYKMQIELAKDSLKAMIGPTK